MKQIAVLTSGGDAPGMNAAIRAAVRCGIFHGLKCFGVEQGYEGLIDGLFRPLDVRDVGSIIQRGGTLLRTSRSDRFMTPEGRREAPSLRLLPLHGARQGGGDQGRRIGEEDQ